MLGKLPSGEPISGKLTTNEPTTNEPATNEPASDEYEQDAQLTHSDSYSNLISSVVLKAPVSSFFYTALPLQSLPVLLLLLLLPIPLKSHPLTALLKPVYCFVCFLAAGYCH